MWNNKTKTTVIWKFIKFKQIQGYKVSCWLGLRNDKSRIALLVVNRKKNFTWKDKFWKTASETRRYDLGKAEYWNNFNYKYEVKWKMFWNSYKLLNDDTIWKTENDRKIEI